jgi:hypothetical protein
MSKPRPIMFHSMRRFYLPAFAKAFSCFVLLASFACSSSLRAQTLDDDYIHIFYTIQEGDALSGIGQPAQAQSKYEKAQKALEQFRTVHPEWHSKIIAYRLSYISNKLNSVSQGGGSPASGGAAATATSFGSKVKLIETGGEPRKTLRLHPKEGDKQSLELTMKTATETKGAEMQMPSAKMPAIKLTMELTVTKVAPNGDISYERTLTDAGVVEEPDALPQVVEAMQSSLASLKGLVGTGVISSRAIVKSADVKIPDSATPQMRQAAEQSKQTIGGLMVPFPEEPVGVGAKWEFTRPIAAQGLKIDQTGTYELVSVEEDRLNVKAALAQTAGKQPMQNPMMPNAKLDLLNLKGQGTGNFTTDMAQLMPADASAEIHSELSMEMNMGAQKTPLTTTTDVNLHLEAK